MCDGVKLQDLYSQYILMFRVWLVLEEGKMSSISEGVRIGTSV
jgi:hypothetical protein